MSCRVYGSGKQAGSEFLLFSRTGKCCTIFDFENCVALISLETLLILAEHPLESVWLLVWHPLEDIHFSAEHPLENKVS